MSKVLVKHVKELETISLELTSSEQKFINSPLNELNLHINYGTRKFLSLDVGYL